MHRACEGVDFVLHQAAIPSVPKSVLDPVGSNQANVDGTVNVLVAARDARVKRVVYAASSSVYGDTPTLPKHERMTARSYSPYAVAKLASEHYMVPSTACYQLETVTLRYLMCSGPSRTLLRSIPACWPNSLADARRQQPTIYGDGEQSRDFTYIDNVVEANLLACGAPQDRAAGKIFNIATGERITLNETFKILRRLTGFAGAAKHTGGAGWRHQTFLGRHRKSGDASRLSPACAV